MVLYPGWLKHNHVLFTIRLVHEICSALELDARQVSTRLLFILTSTLIASPYVYNIELSFLQASVETVNWHKPCNRLK